MLSFDSGCSSILSAPKAAWEVHRVGTCSSLSHFINKQHDLLHPLAIEVLPLNALQYWANATVSEIFNSICAGSSHAV